MIFLQPWPILLQKKAISDEKITKKDIEELETALQCLPYLVKKHINDTFQTNDETGCPGRWSGKCSMQFPYTG